MPAPAVKPAKTLPADVTSFVGRRHDLVAIRQLFTASRLVTLTGMGGVGKTRLALRAAGEMRRAFSDGVILVELSSLSDADLLPQTVHDALGIPEQSAADPSVAIGEYLKERRALLIFDNCEHLVEATGSLVDHVLRTAPEVSILATSRQAMRLAGEYIYPVPPLPAPDPNDLREPGGYSHFPSVALFADRATAVVPDFRVTPENEAAVVRLCHRLEGIPLAIELAAVRLRVLTVDDLARRLDDRFQLLREGSRNLPERHQTLQALIDWSYDLCTRTEQVLWARSAVFAGGFDIEALGAVCTDESFPVSAVLDTVAGLVDKSLVNREQHGKHVRFRMLDTLSEYGRARLAENGDGAAFERRHRDWYAQLLESASRGWAGPNEEWADRLHLEHANVRRALEYCMSTPGQALVGMRMAALPWFWVATNPTEGRLWLDRALALDQEPSLERAWALATNAYLAAFQGELDEMSRLADQAHSLAIDLDDLGALAFTNHVLGFRMTLPGADLASSVPLLTEALAQYEASGLDTRQYVDILLLDLATAHFLLNDHDRAGDLADRLYERSLATGERWHQSYALWLRGLLSLFQGDLHAAEEQLTAALRIQRSLHDNLGLAITLEALAWTAASRGEYDRAATLIGGTDRIWRTLGARHLRRLRERYTAEARSQLGDDRYEATRERGSRMGSHEALAIGLREPPQLDNASAEGQGQLQLTAREREVADLVATGMSNREIAARLVISLRTAEGHVEHILTKRGFKTRAQIASWVTEQQARQS